MADNRKRNPDRLAGRYAARRLVLVLLLAVISAALFIYIGYSMASPGGDAVSEPESTPESIPSQAPEPSSVSEPEPEASEPEASSIYTARPDDWNMILVNKDNPLPDGFSVELETVVDNYRVDARIREALLRMIAEAREDGVVLQVCSAYRDPEYQAVLFDNQVNQRIQTGLTHDQAVAAAATVVAYPGTSEHHTGLAVDIVTPENQNLDESFASTPAFAWLHDNAAAYGFILRFPKDKEYITNIIYEPWHYRYVGVETAKDINEKGVCLEEYVEMLKNPPEPEEPEEEGGAED